jgi:HD-GYP domain-containing protein (c-di-GMP phosphodiesterase class II)
LAVPLESQRNRIGILALDHILPNQYTEQHLGLVKAFSSQVVVALENNRLLNESRQRTQEIEAVYGSALSLTKELEPEVLFEDLYQQIDPLLTPDAFILATYDTSLDMIRVSYATEGGIRQEQAEGMLISPDDKNSLLGWIVRKRSPLLIGDVAADSIPFQPQQEGKKINSFLGVPLLVGDRVCGALVVESYQKASYNRDHQRLLELLGYQVAIALENSRLFEDAKNRLVKLESMRQIELAISGSVDLQISMNVLIRQLISSLDVDAANMLVLNDHGHHLIYLAGHGFVTDSLQHTNLRIGQGLAGKAALQREIVFLDDLNKEETSLDQSPRLSDEGFVSYAAVPLITKGDVVGVLEVFHRSKLSPDDEWWNYLNALAGQAAIAIDRLNLFTGLEKSNIELARAYDATIEGWAQAIELRDRETEGHSRRVVDLTLRLAKRMGIPNSDIQDLRRGALLHDIGKMAIPDSILLKPDKLTEEEWDIMKKHPVHAYRLLSKIEYLSGALDIPYYHHERWDGTGYPVGLSQEDIPISARIFAIVDVWDALQSDRPYRPAWSREKALDYIREMSGSHFDPLVVDHFIKMVTED